MARHVLLVDEDPESTLAVDRQLTDLGYDAVVVTTGEDALRVLAEDLRVDVLLTEVRLPDIDGRELAWAVCRKRPFVRVAFMGHSPPGAPLDVGDVPLLAKPFSATALATALLPALAARPSATPSLPPSGQRTCSFRLQVSASVASAFRRKALNGSIRSCVRRSSLPLD